MDINDILGGELPTPDEETAILEAEAKRQYELKRKADRAAAMEEARKIKEQADIEAALADARKPAESQEDPADALAAASGIPAQPKATPFVRDTDGTVKHVGEAGGEKVPDLNDVFTSARKDAVTPVEPAEAQEENINAILAKPAQAAATATRPASPETADINAALAGIGKASTATAGDLSKMEASSEELAAGDVETPEAPKRDLVQDALKLLPMQAAAYEQAGMADEAAQVRKALKAVRGLSASGAEAQAAAAPRLESILSRVSPEVLKAASGGDRPTMTGSFTGTVRQSMAERGVEPVRPMSSLFGTATDGSGRTRASQVGVQATQDAGGNIRVAGLPSAGVPGQAAPAGAAQAGQGWVGPAGVAVRAVVGVPPVSQTGKQDPTNSRPTIIQGPDGKNYVAILNGRTGQYFVSGLAPTQATTDLRKQATESLMGKRQELVAAGRGVSIPTGATPAQIAEAVRGVYSGLPKAQFDEVSKVSKNLESRRAKMMELRQGASAADTEYALNFDGVGKFTGRGNEGIADKNLIDFAEKVAKGSKLTNLDVTTLETRLSKARQAENYVKGVFGAKPLLDPQARRGLMDALTAAVQAAERANSDQVRAGADGLKARGIPDRVSEAYNRPLFPERMLPEPVRLNFIRSLHDPSTRDTAVANAEKFAEAYPKYRDSVMSLLSGIGH